MANWFDYNIYVRGNRKEVKRLVDEMTEESFKSYLDFRGFRFKWYHGSKCLYWVETHGFANAEGLSALFRDFPQLRFTIYFEEYYLNVRGKIKARNGEVVYYHRGHLKEDCGD